MHYSSLLMQILQSLRHLQDNMPRQLFAEVGESDDLVKELTARAELEDDVVVLSRFGEVDQADDIGMVQLPHDLDFFQNVGTLEKREG